MSRLVTLELGFTWETMQTFMEPIMREYQRTRILSLAIDATRTPLYYVRPEIVRCLE